MYNIKLYCLCNSYFVSKTLYLTSISLVNIFVTTNRTYLFFACQSYYFLIIILTIIKYLINSFLTYTDLILRDTTVRNAFLGSYHSFICSKFVNDSTVILILYQRQKLTTLNSSIQSLCISQMTLRYSHTLPPPKHILEGDQQRSHEPAHTLKPKIPYTMRTQQEKATNCMFSLVSYS